MPFSMPRARRVDVGDEEIVADELELVCRAGRSACFQPSQSSSRQPSSMRDDRVSRRRQSAQKSIMLGARARLVLAVDRRTCRPCVELGRRGVEGEHDVARRACSRPSRWPRGSTSSASSLLTAGSGAKPPSSPTAVLSPAFVQHALQRVEDLGAQRRASVKRRRPAA